MKSLQYPIELEPDEDGYMVVSFPDFPEALTGAKGMDDIIYQATDCLEEALFQCLRNKESIPTPSPAKGRMVISPPTLIATKVILTQAIQEKGITKAELGRRLGAYDQEIARIFDPNHATKITRMEEALAAVGQRMTIIFNEVEPV